MPWSLRASTATTSNTDTAARSVTISPLPCLLGEPVGRVAGISTGSDGFGPGSGTESCRGVLGGSAVGACSGDWLIRGHGLYSFRV